MEGKKRSGGLEVRGGCSARRYRGRRQSCDRITGRDIADAIAAICFYKKKEKEGEIKIEVTPKLGLKEDCADKQFWEGKLTSDHKLKDIRIRYKALDFHNAQQLEIKLRELYALVEIINVLIRRKT